MLQDSPYRNTEDLIATWQDVDVLSESYESSQLIEDFESFCRSNKQPFDKGFWESQLLNPVGNNGNKTGNEDRNIAHKLLISEWRKSLDRAISLWQLDKLSELRSKLMHELEEWLNLLSTLSVELETLGLDPGIWLDLSSGSLTARDIDKFRRWSTYLAEDKGARKVADILGKMRQIESSERIEKVKHSTRTEVPVIDVSSKEEIIGIRLGKDIEHALPSELSLLSDPETSLLFDIKYIESRLLCFEMQGETLMSRDEEVETEQLIEEEDKLGPMILCVDTSGSMHGTPESIAKAMALFLSSQAKEQNRPCYLINFSTCISTFELTGTEGLSSLIQFLSQSFYGGTDVAPALRHALKKMEDESYQKADVLVLSDFIMGTLPSDILSAIEKQRNEGNSFNSLVIGDCFMNERYRTHFDQEWVFDPYTSLIHELVHFRHAMVDAKK
ncbi:MAG: VWA domain-containing protein [Flavobacteriales bacterium]|nr:VWA domain-containing protein [Flavobacteriales bacterium]